jgi:hypothetical protein
MQSIVPDLLGLAAVWREPTQSQKRYLLSSAHGDHVSVATLRDTIVFVNVAPRPPVEE